MEKRGFVKKYFSKSEIEQRFGSEFLCKIGYYNNSILPPLSCALLINRYLPGGGPKIDCSSALDRKASCNLVVSILKNEAISAEAAISHYLAESGPKIDCSLALDRQELYSLVVSILKNETISAEAAKKHNLKVGKIEEWRDKFLLDAEIALRSKPKN